jgi:predicted amidophosphoribosyltransferase
MDKRKASSLLEDVLDQLVEVGNGATDESLHEACDKLFAFRDEYFRDSSELNITCDCCGMEIDKPGALFYKPTQDPKLFEKLHVCFRCERSLDEIIEMLREQNEYYEE